ncbi:MAG TPA: histidine kinase [Pseudonocardia sp.]
MVRSVLSAAAVAMLTVFDTLAAVQEASSRTTTLVWLVALAVSLPLVVRRRWPIPVFGVVLGAAISAVLLGMSPAATVLTVATALFPLALAAGPRCAAVALGIALLGVTVPTVLVVRVLAPSSLLIPTNPQSFETNLLSTPVFSWFIVAGAWALGRSFRARDEYALQLAEHGARQAVAEERLRIAREMHDVVAHSMSVIVMKAAVANHVYESRPEESREALRVVESVGRGALADIQGVLGSLRADGDGELAPSPTLDELPKLIENAEFADVEVELEADSIPPLPSAVQLSAYRIIQEALTNVIRHVTPPARCTVRITADAGELHVAVVNTGKTRRSSGRRGHGLIGMRERVALHRGSLTAGPQPGGGFAVHACLPYQGNDQHV